jgi:hypothetical protein
MTELTESERRLYELAGVVDGALIAHGDGIATAEEALVTIRKAHRQYMDAARADASAAVAAAEVPDELAEHRVVIRLDGGDYELSCTGCSLRGLAPTLRAAVKTKAEHEEAHR